MLRERSSTWGLGLSSSQEVAQRRLLWTQSLARLVMVFTKWNAGVPGEMYVVLVMCSRLL